jgi:hypothetical protein
MGAGHHRPAQPGTADLPRRGRAVVRDALLEGQPRPGLWLKRVAIIALYSAPRAGRRPSESTRLPADPRSHPPAPGWSRDGHHIGAHLDYGCGPEKVWIYGALRVREGWAATLTAASRKTADYLRPLEAPARAELSGDRNLIGGDLSSRKGLPVAARLEAHPRVHQASIPVGACRLNFQEAWWHRFRREAVAGQNFFDADEIDRATRVTTARLNRRAKPWVWNRPPNPPATAAGWRGSSICGMRQRTVRLNAIGMH